MLLRKNYLCSLPSENIIDSVDVKNLYEIPINYYNQHFDEIILKSLGLNVKKANLKYWTDLIDRVNGLDKEIEIALVGKYVELHDAYISVAEALKHAGYKYNSKIKIKWVSSEDLEKDTNLKEVFKDTKGIIVPGGFGTRGTLGMMKATEYARVNKIPFLGICLGMQIAVIEYARDVLGLSDATSTEFDSFTNNPVIDLMADQKAISNMGGTLRLGNYECSIKKDSLASKLYKEEKILERHRHRYEFNNAYREEFEKNGLVISGINDVNNLVEIIEIKDHPFFIACQFHPEFKSRPTRPHPLFDGFIKASIK